MIARLQVRKKSSQKIELLGQSQIKSYIRAGELTPDDEVMNERGCWLPLAHRIDLLGLEETLNNAKELYEQGWRRTAIKQFERILAFDVSIVEVCLYLALGYSRIGAYKRSEQFYQQCLKRGYKPGIAYNNLGVVSVYLRRSPSEAIEYFKKAAENYPFMQAAPHYNLETVYWHLHQIGKKLQRGESEEWTPSTYLELAKKEQRKAQELEQLYAFLQDRDAELLFHEDIPLGFGAELIYSNVEEQEKENIKKELHDAKVCLNEGLLDDAILKLELLLARAEACEDKELKERANEALKAAKFLKRTQLLETLDQSRRGKRYEDAIKIARKIGQLDESYAKQATAMEEILKKAIEQTHQEDPDFI